jgi:hypothetical protein
MADLDRNLNRLLLLATILAFLVIAILECFGAATVFPKTSAFLNSNREEFELDDDIEQAIAVRVHLEEGAATTLAGGRRKR